MSSTNNTASITESKDATDGSEDAENTTENASDANAIEELTSTPIKVDKKLPRSQRKRLIREQRRAKRKSFKQEGLGQKSEKPCTNSEDTKVDNDDGHISKRIRLQLAKERCQEALQTGQRVCIDLSLEKHMNQKEHGKLAQQLCRLYGSNRQALHPMHIFFTGFKKNGELYKECVRKNAGFEGYLIDMSEKSHMELFPKEEIVYLTPDSETVLDKVESDKVYVIGGLVDESITNNITNGYAKQLKIQTARLPIEEKMQKSDKGTFIKVLAVNQVFDILLELSESGDWNKALSAGVPRRTGYIVQEERKVDQSDQ